MNLQKQSIITATEITITVICLFLLFAQQTSNADFQHENHMQINFLRFDIFTKLFGVIFEITSNII